METILIMGARGFIGKNLCTVLSSNYKIIAYDRSNDSIIPHPNIEHVQGDFSDPESYEGLLSMADVIIDLIGSSGARKSIEDPDPFIKTNIVDKIRFLDTISKQKKRRKLFFSVRD